MKKDLRKVEILMIGVEKMRLKPKLILFVIILCGIINFLDSKLFAVNKLDETTLSKGEVYTWEDKLKRGGINFVTSPKEVSYSVRRVSQERGKKSGWTVGLLEGLGRMTARGFYGLVELFTFPFNFPDDDKAPMMEPEFVWQR